MNKKVKNIILCVILLIVACVYTFLVTKIDVKAIGPQNTSVGFSTINKYFTDIIGSNLKLYKITEYLGYLAITIAGVYAILGLIELIKRKSLKKVDVEIYILACFYVLVLGVYFLFEKVIINHRPIIIDGILENILLSKLNEISETIISQFKIKFKNFVKENENQSINYYDLITFYFNFQNFRVNIVL